MKGGSDKMLKYSKSRRFLGFVRDATGRTVQTLDKLLAPPTARESLQRLIEAGASPGRIEMHPLVREAYRVAKTYPPTNEMPGYGGSE